MIGMLGIVCLVGMFVVCRGFLFFVVVDDIRDIVSKDLVYWKLFVCGLVWEIFLMVLWEVSVYDVCWC